MCTPVPHARTLSNIWSYYKLISYTFELRRLPSLDGGGTDWKFFLHYLHRWPERGLACEAAKAFSGRGRGGVGERWKWKMTHHVGENNRSREREQGSKEQGDCGGIKTLWIWIINVKNLIIYLNIQCVYIMKENCMQSFSQSAPGEEHTEKMTPFLPASHHPYLFFSDVTFPWPLPLLVSALTSLRQAHTDTVPPQGAPNNQQSLHQWRLNIDFHSVFECCIRPLTPYVPGLDIFHGLGISWIVNLCWVYLVRVAPSAWQLTFACLIRVPEAEYRAFRRWRRWGRQRDKLFFFFFRLFSPWREVPIMLLACLHCSKPQSTSIRLSLTKCSFLMQLPES